MSTTVEAAHTAQAKDAFFAASMYMFHVTGFPQRSGVLTQPAAALAGPGLAFRAQAPPVSADRTHPTGWPTSER